MLVLIKLAIHRMGERHHFGHRRSRNGPFYYTSHPGDFFTDKLTPFQPQARIEAMTRLTSHPGFRASHPRAEHFVPIYVAAGAGNGNGNGAGAGGGAKVLFGVHGCISAAFGV
jgi:aromatic ring-opening dioxygenase catalytic subunit (LigB family)